MSSVETLKVVGGPSREELFDSLRLIAERREVTFIASDGKQKRRLVVTLFSLEAYDGDGSRWIVKCAGRDHCGRPLIDSSYVDFDVKTRKGSFLCVLG